MRNRSHNVMVRMDDEEYNQFCTNVKESGQTKQAYVTNAVLHVPVMPKEELDRIDTKILDKYYKPASEVI